MKVESYFLACCFLLLTGCGGDAEPVGNSDIEYVSPVDYEIVLAGNFGEPRPWHFHGGIDIKTGNQEGKKIYSVAEGYVSHITVNKHGFGNAIYVAHPDGLTSVYCHLKRFADVYEQQLQRTGWRDTLEVRFAPGQFPVKAGGCPINATFVDVPKLNKNGWKKFTPFENHHYILTREHRLVLITMT